ncbi:hypothetical protein VT52_002145 [Streptomyces malaysiense]|uniref:DUF6777 domain-containing protein n=2 Tax=Streptomyces malaysiense TaxID=1428626 RepID=A0A1J4Q9V5_9ACTN|nr:hypothetical protein VT52_002145 [Streptomyces malaysiense]
MVMACVLLSVALLLTGCAGAAVKEAQLGEEVFLQPAAEQGPNPFTASTANGSARTGTPRSAGTGGTADVSAPPAGLAVAPLAAARALSGGTPGLYSGSVRVAGCDVERQIDGLTADPAREDAFAHVAGVSRTDLPGYLRALTPVLLRADTRVTNHGYRDGQNAGYQAVLQAGTAVLVDNRGVPRVRCACGNPLRPPEEARGGVGARGTAWPGYRPNQVIVVTPATQAVDSLTLLDAGTNTWIERRVGPDVSNDHLVAPPAVSETAPPDPGLTGFPHPSRPDTGSPSPRESGPDTAAGEIGGAVAATGRVTAGRGAGRGERADDRRTRADGIGTGTRERGARAVRQGVTGRGESRPPTGSHSAEARPDAGTHGADSAGGQGTHAADARVSPAPDAHGTAGRTGHGTGAGDASGAPAAPGHGTRTSDASGAPVVSGRGARTSDASGAPVVSGHGTQTSDVPSPPVATGDSPRAVDTSATPAAPDRGPRTAEASGDPAADAGRATPAADARGASAAPERSTPASTASPEARAVLPSVPPASSGPSDPPAAPEPTPSVSSAAPTLRDPLAYPPDTSLYDPPSFGDALTPKDSDEIGPANVTGTPAMPPPSGTDTSAAPGGMPEPGGGTGGAAPTPAGLLGG